MSRVWRVWKYTCYTVTFICLPFVALYVVASDISQVVLGSARWTYWGLAATICAWLTLYVYIEFTVYVLKDSKLKKTPN